MNQFTVPQFIDVEDKIFGPITTRQFVILLVAGGICFLGFKLADTTLFIFILALVGGGALTLAFVKINGQAFHYFILNLIQTLRRPSRRVWNKSYTNMELSTLIKEKEIPEVEMKVLTQRAESTKIRELALQVNTGGYYKGE